MRTILCVALCCIFVPHVWAQQNQDNNNTLTNTSIFNPQISAAATLLGGYSTGGHDEGSEESGEHASHAGLKSGMQIQEIELRFSGNVDPYLRLELGLVGHNHDGALEVGIEDAFISTLALPDLTIRAGQFLVNFGKANQRHVHARHFIGAPLPLVSTFGTDHLIGTGLSLDYLTPLPFYTELNLQAFKANWESGAHAHGEPGETHESDPLDLTYLGHLKTFFDLGENTTMELGGSAMISEDSHGHWEKKWGADLTFKWVPSNSGRYTSFEWNTEYMSATSDHVTKDGLYTSFRYQAAQQWWGQLRGSLLGVLQEDQEKRYRGEALMAFNPSERSSVRLQYGVEGALEDEHGEVSGGTHEHHESIIHEVFLQFIVSIGTHPAHAY